MYLLTYLLTRTTHTCTSYRSTWNTRAILPMARILLRITSFLAAMVPPADINKSCLTKLRRLYMKDACNRPQRRCWEHLTHDKNAESREHLTKSQPCLQRNTEKWPWQTDRPMVYQYHTQSTMIDMWQPWPRPHSHYKAITNTELKSSMASCVCESVQLTHMSQHSTTLCHKKFPPLNSL